MALKTSVLIFYLRLSKNTQQVLRIASWVVLAIVNVAGTVLTFMNIFQCQPIQAAFSLYQHEARCIPLLTEFICSAPVNVVTDLAILALPIPVLTGMRLPWRQKCVLVFTFSLGIFVTVVDVVRIYYLQQAISTVSTITIKDTSSMFGDSPEFAWTASFSLMWSAVEVNVGMICACIPTLKPLIVKILPAAIIDPHQHSHNSEASTYVTDTREKDTTHATRNASDPPTPNEGPSNLLVTAPSPTARPSVHRQSTPGEAMGMLEFLASSGVANNQNNNNINNQAPPTLINEPVTRATWMSHRSKRDNAVYFGFVNMKRPKSMIKTSMSESIRYCIIVTVLFLLWGFSYGLLNTLNNAIASIADMTQAETIGLTSVYFGGGYFFGPLIVGEWVLRHDEHARFSRRSHKYKDRVGGFKATFIMGLCIYGVGTIMFWPSAVLTSFPGFLISNLVVGFGFGVLETAANPFIILCGPPQYAETRILVSQGFQGVAAVISGVLAQKVFFVNVGNGSSETSLELIDVQWTYLAITLLCVVLALFFYYMPLPEVRDAELGRAAERLPVNTKKRSIGGLQLRTVCVILAVLAQWTYVAAQESMSIFFKDLLVSYLPTSTKLSTSDWPQGLTLSATNYILIAHSVFAISRFNAAHITWLGVRHPQNRFIPSPRMMLVLFSFLSVICALICVVLKPTNNPNLIAVPIILFFFAEGPIWPLIFALGLRGQGDRTKRASAWLTMGASGPAFWPFVMYWIIGGRMGRDSSAQLAFIVVFVLLLFTLLYPVFLSIVRDARILVDHVEQKKEAPVGTRGGGGQGQLAMIESQITTRDMNMSMEDIMWARLQDRRGSTATTASNVGALLYDMVDRVGGYLGVRKHEKRMGSSSTEGQLVF